MLNAVVGRRHLAGLARTHVDRDQGRSRGGRQLSLGDRGGEAWLPKAAIWPRECH